MVKQQGDTDGDHGGTDHAEAAKDGQCKADEEERQQVLDIQILQQHFSDVYKLEYDVPKQHKHNWAYINWLQTDKVLLIPSFGCSEDELAVEQITSYMPMYKDRVEMVPANDLIRHEGCLNCASWTVRV